MNKNTKRLIIFIVALFILYIGTSFSDNLSIRRVIFLHGHPIQAFITDIGKNYNTNKNNGSCYTVNDSKSQEYADKPTAVLGVCLKKNKMGMNYKGTIGLF